MRTLTDGTLTVEAYDFSVWKQEKNILRVTDTSSRYVTLYDQAGGQWQALADYTLDANGQVVIDCSDYIRIKDNSVLIVENDHQNACFADYEVVGLINPLNVIIPESVSGLKIQSPSMIYAPIVTGLFAAEMLNTDDVIMGVFQYAYSSLTPVRLDKNTPTIWTPQRPNNFSGLIISDLGYMSAMHAGGYTFILTSVEAGKPAPYCWVSTVAKLSVYTKVRNPRNDVDYAYTDNEAKNVYYICNGEFWTPRHIETIICRKLECGKLYAAVRWVSFTGQTRIHTWEVTKAKTAVQDALELLTVDNSYNVIKGREDGFVLRLDGLNAYDMWYYSDIITSLRVEVSFDGQTWQQIEVTTKDVTIPDGNAGKMNTLEINCNWRKYDAITL